jgi:basic membrane lipoprotein Med (substrate-binding protein (PBP1-ABC) superfamily)
MTGSGTVRIWLALLALVVAGAGTAAWLLWPRSAPAPQARQYLNVSACLLTDPRGVVPGTPAAPVWAAMESASQTTHVMVSYLPDTGPADITPMLSTLIERQCGVIITTGADASQVISAAKADPNQHFLLITAAGAAITAAPANAAIVSPATAADRIDQTIRALAAQA